MAFEMKLNDEPFQKIRDGEKTIELRLYDEKRQKIDLGDFIIFSKISNSNEKIATKVKALYRANSFSELFDDIGIEKCGNSKSTSIEDVVRGMRKYYSEEAECQYGVVGIKIELFDLEELRGIEEKIAEAQYEHFFPDGMK